MLDRFRTKAEQRLKKLGTEAEQRNNIDKTEALQSLNRCDIEAGHGHLQIQNNI